MTRSADPRMHPRPRYGRLTDHVPGTSEAAKWRAARRGEIPGAFQLRRGGTWFIDLDVWDAHVAALLSRSGEGARSA